MVPNTTKIVHFAEKKHNFALSVYYILKYEAFSRRIIFLAEAYLLSLFGEYSFELPNMYAAVRAYSFELPNMYTMVEAYSFELSNMYATVGAYSFELPNMYAAVGVYSFESPNMYDPTA